MKQISIAELPETIQNLINQLRKTGEPLTIIQDGIPFAILTPIKTKSLCNRSFCLLPSALCLRYPSRKSSL
jgi:antitoxin VapB